MKKPTKLIVLDTPVVVTVRGKIEERKYQGVIYTSSFYDGWLINIEQKIGDEWFATGGGWLLNSLKERGFKPGDMLAIDAGQGWIVHEGMAELIEEAMENL